MQTAERSSGLDPSENVIYHRCLFAYEAASTSIAGKVVELGSGEGYGIRMIAPKSSSYLAVDKFKPLGDIPKGVEFRQLMLPSLQGIADSSFDFAITFQVIEHIRDDNRFLSEIHRVLKPGGCLMLTTPNRLMSLSRNPWHVREYTGEELKSKVQKVFNQVELLGVFGNEAINRYHDDNRKSVQAMMKWDIFNLQYRLPAVVLRLPYDVLNRINRRKLLQSNGNPVLKASTSDFRLDVFTDKAYDLFIRAVK